MSGETQKVKIVTDGSCSPCYRIGAWASRIIMGADSIILQDTENNTSQHAMELKAIIISLQYIQSRFQKVFDLEVYTDSQYVLTLVDRQERLVANDFQSRKGRPIANQELIRRFYELLKHFNVRMIKVSGHTKSGISQINDYHRDVDKLSRKLVRQEIANL